MKRASLKSTQRTTALKRIETLFSEASIRPEFANSYVALARKISLKFKVKVPSQWKRRFCKKCLAFLTPGRNSRIRTVKGKVVMTCLDCGNITRIPKR